MHCICVAVVDETFIMSNLFTIVATLNYLILFVKLVTIITFIFNKYHTQSEKYYLYLPFVQAARILTTFLCSPT